MALICALKDILPFHVAEHRRNGRKKREDCLSHAVGVTSSAAPGYFEEHRESAIGGQVTGCPFFWFVFFGPAKKMNN